MKLIAAVSENWGIGKDNRLLFDIPSDMRFFRETTTGKTVIMGRKNLESFPNGKPLRNRRNIVLSRDKSFRPEGAETAGGISDLIALGCMSDDTFVIGGESVYRLLLDYCDTCYITKVHETVDCDRFMVNLDERPEWRLVSESGKTEDNGHIISFCTYERVKEEE